MGDWLVLDKSGYKINGSDEVAEICSECGSKDIRTDYTRGETICSNCGVVLSFRNIDQGPEWRAFSTEDLNKRSRVGSPSTSTIPDKGLSTVIDWHNRDAFGQQLTPNRKAQLYRLRKWQIRTRVHSSLDRNLAIAMSELDRLSSQLGIPWNIKETAAILYRRAVEKKLIRGRSIEAMITASVYAACRTRKVPYTLEEIAQYSRVNHKKVGQCYRYMLNKLNLIIPMVSPIDFIPRFSTILVLSVRTQQKAVNILTLAHEKGITVGKDPSGLAAAALYIAAILEENRRTQCEIAQVAHVTEVTVRNRYKEMLTELNIHLDV